jgi:hypothetical protein
MIKHDKQAPNHFLCSNDELHIENLTKKNSKPINIFYKKNINLYNML